MNDETTFRKELEITLNKHCMENESNTPDYLLADYLISCLDAFNVIINERAKWYGRMDEPGESVESSVESSDD